MSVRNEQPSQNPETDQPEPWPFQYHDGESLTPRDRETSEIFAKYYKSPEFSERVYAHMTAARQRLLRNYGIDNLTNIEGVRLRKIVEECLSTQEREAEEVKRGEITGRHEFDTEVEAPARWLLELYGINIKDFTHAFHVYDDDTDKVYVFDEMTHLKPQPGVREDVRWDEALNKAKEMAIKKEEQLRKLGHSVRWQYHQDDRIKELIHRQREAAHEFPTNSTD